MVMKYAQQTLAKFRGVSLYRPGMAPVCPWGVCGTPMCCPWAVREVSCGVSVRDV